ERAVQAILREELPDLPVSLSSDVAPEIGEFLRTSTTVANAYVTPLVGRYVEMLEKRMEGLGLSGPLRIMLSTGGGGLAGAATARRYPVRLLESGPAAGALSAGFWGAAAGRPDVLAFDMGGTTAKACLIEDGRPMVAREVEAARVYRFTKGSGLPLRVPVIDLIEVGAGGGSLAGVGPFGLPTVGPESAGAGPVHAWGVARALGIRTLLFPPSAGLASAFGMLTAPPGLELARSLPEPLSGVRWGEVRRAIASLVKDGSREVRSGGVAQNEVRVSIAADVRHRGQGDSVTVELGSGLANDPARQVEEAFEQAYVRLYGRRPPGVEAEVMTWRVRVLGPDPRVDVTAAAERGAARKRSRSAWFQETGLVEVSVLDRYKLGPGREVVGPCVVEEQASTVVIGPGGRGKVDGSGSLVVEVG